MPWSGIAQVSSGVTLAAFVAATAAWILHARILQRERLIRTAPEAARAELVARALEVFHVETANLTKVQQYDLAVRQIVERARRFRLLAGSIVAVTVIAAAVSGLALLKQGEPEREQQRALTGSLSSDLNAYFDRVRNVCENIDHRRMNATELTQLAPNYNFARQALLLHADAQRQGLRQLFGPPAAEAYEKVYSALFDAGGVDSIVYDLNVASVDKLRANQQPDYAELDEGRAKLGQHFAALGRALSELYDRLGARPPLVATSPGGICGAGEKTAGNP